MKAKIRVIVNRMGWKKVWWNGGGTRLYSGPAIEVPVLTPVTTIVDEIVEFDGKFAIEVDSVQTAAAFLVPPAALRRYLEKMLPGREIPAYTGTRIQSYFSRGVMPGLVWAFCLHHAHWRDCKHENAYPLEGVLHGHLEAAEEIGLPDSAGPYPVEP